MDFLKSVFSDDPEPTSPLNPQTTPPSSPDSQSPNPNPDSGNPPSLPTISTAWSFGSTLLRTIATKSESVIETYRRDLEEFSSGLKLETATIREAASRAVHDLPARLETGAAVAQTSLESVGLAIDNIADVIVTRGKDSISLLTSDDVSDSELNEDSERFNQKSEIYDNNVNYNANNAKPYSRIEAAIRSIQCDLKTYCEEPEDLEDYIEWKKLFVLEEKSDEIENVVNENGVVKEIYDEVVPGTVEHKIFWARYFYRVYRVRKAEEARVRLVKRAIEGEEEEELSWDVDEEEDEEEGFKSRDDLKMKIEESGKKVESLRIGDEKSYERESDEMEGASDARSDGGLEEKGKMDEAESSGEKVLEKSDEKASSDGKNDSSDFSVVSSQPSHEEEDLGWDEIEDVGSGDESKVVARASPNTADLRKRLSVAEEDEDLSWDIEDDDDDEAVKS